MAVDEEDKVFAIQRPAPLLPLRDEAGSIMRPECHDVRPTPTSAPPPSLPILPLSLLSPISATSVTSTQPPANYKPTPATTLTPASTLTQNLDSSLIVLLVSTMKSFVMD